jgi:hypothetical protein
VRAEEYGWVVIGELVELGMEADGVPAEMDGAGVGSGEAGAVGSAAGCEAEDD